MIDYERTKKQMGAYQSFAQVYDIFMDNIPYKDWSEYLVSILKEHGCFGGLLLDLACGTGTLTELLKASGYDMIGIDNSAEMLGIAAEKNTDQKTLYLLQDMREFELYGTVGAVICACDSINYLLEYRDLVAVFRLINNYLDPGGLFIFDINTIYKYETILGDTVIAENREEASFIWENYYDAKEHVNEYAVTFFVKENGNRYRKFEEFHYQKGYTLKEVKEALSRSGLQFVTAYDAFTKKPPERKSERIFIVAKENGKRKKEA